MFQISLVSQSSAPRSYKKLANSGKIERNGLRVILQDDERKTLNVGMVVTFEKNHVWLLLDKALQANAVSLSNKRDLSLILHYIKRQTDQQMELPIEMQSNLQHLNPSGDIYGGNYTFGHSGKNNLL